ncbi:hypothetical protein NMG60_11005105 [Bertholletia excelsa]
MDLGPSSTLQKGRPGRKGKGPYVGVRLRGGRWVSEIRVPRTSTRIWLGSHDSAEKAAQAYDAALYCLKGEEGVFNFPGNARPNLDNRAVGSLSINEIQSIAARSASSDEMVEASQPSTMLPPWASDLSLVPPALSDLQTSNEVSVDEVEGGISALEYTPEADSFVPTTMPEEPYIPFPEEKPYVPAMLHDEPYIPTFVAEEELHVAVYGPEAVSVPCGVPELDEWFGTDEDWTKSFHPNV